MTTKEKRAYDKAWRAANPDKVKAYRNKTPKETLHAWNKARYERDKEKIKARTKAYVQANPEKVSASRKRHYSENKERRLASSRAWVVKNSEYVAKTQRFRAISKKYGLNEKQYQIVLKGQGGVCAICGKEPNEGKHLCVDHDHDTGIVRGLLCRNCNAAIGQLGDSIDTLKTAIHYLEQHLTATTSDHKEISN